jgi:DNA-binding transcriptional LysR family regulator
MNERHRYSAVALFVTVAEEQRFARAAWRLGITLPTLADQIRKLESRLSAKLFEPAI